MELLPTNAWFSVNSNLLGIDWKLFVALPNKPSFTQLCSRCSFQKLHSTSLTFIAYITVESLCGPIDIKLKDMKHVTISNRLFDRCVNRSSVGIRRNRWIFCWCRQDTIRRLSCAGCFVFRFQRNKTGKIPGLTYWSATWHVHMPLRKSETLTR